MSVKLPDAGYSRFLEALDKVEAGVPATIADAKVIAAQYRKLEAKRDELEHQLVMLKKRISDVLEDF